MCSFLLVRLWRMAGQRMKRIRIQCARCSIAPRLAKKRLSSAEEALQAATLFFQYYRENANYLERTYDFVERWSIEKARRETVYAPLAIQQGLRERLRKSKRISRDAWLEGDAPRHPTQFVQIEPLEKVQA
jgi:NAD(P)H-nitrite reductase large subunit